MLWIVFVTNAFQFLDHCDGVMGAVAAVTALGIAVCAIAGGHPGNGLLLSVLAAALTGFLLHNWHPARIHLGHCGALFTGFLLASSAVTVHAGEPGGRTTAELFALTVLVLTDTLLVLLSRRRAGRPALRGGGDHIAHRLRALGLTTQGSAVVLGLASLACTLIALQIHDGQLAPVAAVPLALVVPVAGGAVPARAGVRTRLAPPPPARPHPLGPRPAHRLRRPRRRPGMTRPVHPPTTPLPPGSSTDVMTTLARHLRRAVRRLGIDVVRHRPAGQDLVRLLRRYEIDLVLDVGAYRGDFGGLLREAGYQGRIVSFEPLREPRCELRHRAGLDDAWSVLPYALGDRAGTATLNICGDAGPASSFLPMLPRHRAAAPGAAYTGDVIVETRRLDEVWKQVTAPGERVFLALDVQGYEAQVLDGAGEFADEICGVRIGAPSGAALRGRPALRRPARAGARAVRPDPDVARAGLHRPARRTAAPLRPGAAARGRPRPVGSGACACACGAGGVAGFTCAARWRLVAPTRRSRTMSQPRAPKTRV